MRDLIYEPLQKREYNNAIICIVKISKTNKFIISCDVFFLFLNFKN